LVILFMAFDGIIKLVPLDIVVETTAQLGYPASETLSRAASASWASSARCSTRSRAPRCSARSC
jgi:hypothetical protein